MHVKVGCLLILLPTIFISNYAITIAMMSVMQTTRSFPKPRIMPHISYSATLDDDIYILLPATYFLSFVNSISYMYNLLIWDQELC